MAEMDLDVKKPLVSAEWLIRNIDSDILIVDCRWDLFDYDKGPKEYGEGHIPGAVHVSMESELADLSRKNMGRHPIPDEGKFTAVAEKIGITDDTTVIGYDNDSSGASRLWFLLKFYGHDKVFILDGGIKAYLEAGGPLTREVPELHRATFHAEIRTEMIVTTEEVRKGSLNLVDSREPERYRGEFEPIDPKAGHIPGASNFPFRIYVENGKFKDVKYLKELMKEIGDNPVFYCGSGITSCIPYVAAVIAGANPKLYPGSYSAWVNYKETNVITGNSKF